MAEAPLRSTGDPSRHRLMGRWLALSAAMQSRFRKRLHVAALLLLAAAFYGGFILMQWVRSSA